MWRKNGVKRGFRNVSIDGGAFSGLSHRRLENVTGLSVIGTLRRPPSLVKRLKGLGPEIDSLLAGEDWNIISVQVNSCGAKGIVENKALVTLGE